jgi:hypothetical protein
METIFLTILIAVNSLMIQKDLSITQYDKHGKNILTEWMKVKMAKEMPAGLKFEGKPEIS